MCNPKDFGIQIEPNFLHINKELVSKYIPNCVRIIAANQFLICENNNYRVKIYFVPTTQTYVAYIYDKQIERNNEYCEDNDSYEDPEMDHITVIGINYFHSLLDKVYDKLTKLDKLCI